MTVTEAKKSVKKWRRWASRVRRRWRADSPMIELADRLVREAEQRLQELQTEKEQG